VPDTTAGALVTECRQFALHGGDVLAAHDDVEVVVRPRLASNERVDAPTAVEPDGQPGSLQASDDRHHILRRHVPLGHPAASCAYRLGA
jgi:hypothetical protein